MAPTDEVRKFFRAVADHLEGIRPVPDPKEAAALLRMVADSEPAPDGGWQKPESE